MQDTLSVSEQGLRLIKAFEGFRPVDRKLVGGTRVVGHGHRVRGGEAMRLDAEAAHAVLLEDLAPFEDMLNENVYASVSQAQFDALASLAYNIGPKAFLDSDVLGAVNAGRTLEAASAFDAWRMADIGGRTFVVDALVRRRTAEKALFLRPGSDALAPKAPTPDLGVEVDTRVFVDDRELDVLDRDAAGRLVADAPYEVERLITDLPSRRRDDAQVGELAWSEVEIDGDSDAGVLEDVVGLDELEVFEDLDATVRETPLDAPARSVIAEAADDVRDRLAALMEDPADDMAGDAFVEDWPESLIQPAEREDSKVVAFPTESVARKAPGALETDGESPADGRLVFADDLPPLELTERLRERRDMRKPDALDVTDGPDWIYDTEGVAVDSSPAPYLALMIVGGGLLGAGAMALLRGVDRVLGMPGELAGLGAAMLGALILVGGLGYLIKQIVGRKVGA